MKFRPVVGITAILCLFTSCKMEVEDYNTVIEVYPAFSDLQKKIDGESDKLLVLNFWATTCPPCIKEMPHFRELEEEYPADALKVLLVSTDLIKDLDKRVYPFVTKHDIKPEVALLEDQNYSAWTEKVDTSWYGALPATLIRKGDKRHFKFGFYEVYAELKADVDAILSE